MYEHQVIDHLIFSRQESRKLFLKFVRRQISEKPESSQINSQNRPLVRSQLSTGSQDGPVTAEDNHDIRLLATEFQFVR